MITQCKVTLRPFVKEFLTTISDYYYLVLFVACDENYLGQVLPLVDPLGIFFKDRLTKADCVRTKGEVQLVLLSDVEQGFESSEQYQHEQCPHSG